MTAPATIDETVDREPRYAAANRAKRKAKAERSAAELLERASTLEIADLARITVQLMAECERRCNAGVAPQLVPVFLRDNLFDELAEWAGLEGLSVPEAAALCLYRLFFRDYEPAGAS